MYVLCAWGFDMGTQTDLLGYPILSLLWEVKIGPYLMDSTPVHCHVDSDTFKCVNIKPMMIHPRANAQGNNEEL